MWLGLELLTYMGFHFCGSIWYFSNSWSDLSIFHFLYDVIACCFARIASISDFLVEVGCEYDLIKNLIETWELLEVLIFYLTE